MQSQKPSINLTVGQTLGLGFGTVCTLIFMSNLFSQWTHHRTSVANEDVALAYQIQDELFKLDKALAEAESGQQAFLYTGQDVFLEPYIQARQEIDDDIRKIEGLIINEAQQEEFAVLKVLIQDRINYLSEIIALARIEGQEAQVKERVISGEGQQLRDQVNSSILEMEIAEEEILQIRQQNVQSAQQLNTIVSWGSTSLIITICLAILWMTNRIIQQSLDKAVKAAESVATGDLTHPIEVISNDGIGRVLIAIQNMTQNLNDLISQVSQSGIQVTSAATQITASSQQLESSMTKQAAATNEITATAKEIAVTSEELAQAMERLSSISNNTTTIASEGQKNLVKMETTIRQLSQSTHGIAAKLGLINDKANNINTVVTTITKVADQTNLLSLNAAIEAEKAGEYGVGFSVVAREIRRLADQTAVATLEIENMVQDMQSSVSTGVMEMDKFTQDINQGVIDVQDISQQIGSIIDQIQNLTPQFNNASQGMEAQSQGAQQIRIAMEQLNNTSQQTIDAVQESNQSIGMLNQVVHMLQKEISRFKVGVSS